VPIVWLRAAIYLNQQKRLCTQEMAVCASAVVVILVWSMIIYHRFLAEVVVKFLIFNYCAGLVIEVNQIAAIVKYTIIKWGLIVVKEVPQSNLQQPQSNVLELLKKELDVEIEPSILADVVITTNNT